MDRVNEQFKIDGIDEEIDLEKFQEDILKKMKEEAEKKEVEKVKTETDNDEVDPQIFSSRPIKDLPDDAKIPVEDKKNWFRLKNREFPTEYSERYTTISSGFLQMTINKISEKYPVSKIDVPTRPGRVSQYQVFKIKLNDSDLFIINSTNKKKSFEVIVKYKDIILPGFKRKHVGNFNAEEILDKLAGIATKAEEIGEKLLQHLRTVKVDPRNVLPGYLKRGKIIEKYFPEPEIDGFELIKRVQQIVFNQLKSYIPFLPVIVNGLYKKLGVLGILKV